MRASESWDSNHGTPCKYKLFPLQLLVVSLAWVSCCTRISDNVHHWGDVVVGMALGAAVALWVAFCLLPNGGGLSG